MERHRDDQDLAAELRALRPAPRPAFTAELDARVAAGFPSRPRRGASGISRLTGLLDAIPKRRMLAPAGACAVAAIVIATAVVTVTESEPDGSTNQGIATTSRLSGPEPGRLGEAGRPGPFLEGTAASKAAPGVSSSATEFSDASGTQLAPLNRNSSGPYASQAGRREIERSAQLVLGTDPSEVRDDAARVFETVHSYDGIVLHSSIRDGESGEAGATFDLLIPTAKLGDALAAFSEIAEVRSRHESTQDITAPIVTLGERLQDTRAKVEGLLAQLASADTDAERDAVEAELRQERFRVASLRSHLTTLERRANLSHVSLRIETGEGGSTTDEGDDTGSWGVGDAVDDAGHILGVAAGVTVVGLALIAPLAILALLAWFIRRTWVRRGRERTLD
ncbi:MAG: DUF4349 domain-containing protein [Solirubrobacterales bacterium]